jgi:hypothetical protein
MLYNKVVIQDNMIIIMITSMDSYGVPLFVLMEEGQEISRNQKKKNLNNSKQEMNLNKGFQIMIK